MNKSRILLFLGLFIYFSSILSIDPIIPDKILVENIIKKLNNIPKIGDPVIYKQVADLNNALNKDLIKFINSKPLWLLDVLEKGKILDSYTAKYIKKPQSYMTLIILGTFLMVISYKIFNYIKDRNKNNNDTKLKLDELSIEQQGFRESLIKFKQENGWEDITPMIKDYIDENPDEFKKLQNDKLKELTNKLLDQISASAIFFYGIAKPLLFTVPTFEKFIKILRPSNVLYWIMRNKLNLGTSATFFYIFGDTIVSKILKKIYLSNFNKTYQEASEFLAIHAI